jgi:hypothetical protein
MNGFRVLAVGAFLYCGPSFCHAQINNLQHKAQPRSILVKAVQDDAFQPAQGADLTRSRTSDAEISTDPIENPFPGTNSSPSEGIEDKSVVSSPTSDPESLPVGIRHRHNPIDQILRNGLISQTPNSAQVPVSWPMQSVYNPTARMMLIPSCTQGLWDGYPAERAAQCALMYQRLAGNQHSQGCGQNCGTGCKSCRQTGCAPSGCGNAHFQPINRYAPAICDTGSHPAAKKLPQFQSLLAPAPTVAEPLADESSKRIPENQDNVAQLPGLFR